MGAVNGGQQTWGPIPVPSGVQLCLLQKGPEGLVLTVNDAEGVSLTSTCVRPPGILAPLGRAWVQQEAISRCGRLLAVDHSE